MANVLLIIDMLRGFYDLGNLRNPLMERIIPCIVQMAEEKKREGWRIIFLADNHEKDDPEFQQFPEHCLVGTEEAELVPELRPYLEERRTNYIPKRTHDGFFLTDLEEILIAEDPEVVRVVGTCTDICVKYTVYRLRQLGFRVEVAANCVTTYDIPGQHEADRINAYELRHMHDILGAEIIPPLDIA